ncbi:unnamed protein product [Trichobilharzia regenti]|nr:unnamed protein product [Trichobilharzia regenti]
MAYEPRWVTGNHGNAALLPCGLDSKSKAQYKAGAVDWNASHSVLSENPLLHIQLPGNYCPIEMDVLSNDNNDLQYCCCSNPLNNIIQLPIEYYSVKQDNQIKRDAKFTLQSFIDCTSGDLSMCCFLLTISGSLLQVNFYNDFSCLIQLLISDPISCIDEDIQQKNEKTDEETTSVNVHRIQFNAFTYCTGLGNLCLCTVDGQMCIYQLYNQELFKYDMNKEKRITLKSSASSVNIKKSKTSSSIIDNTSITSCSLSDLYAYCNSPIDQCIILHQLIQTIPVDAQIQINFPDRIGWYEVDLFRSIISPSPSDGRINNTRFEKKDMLTDDQDPKISSSSNDNETIHILSRLVTRYLQLEGCDSSNKSKLTTSTTNNLPVALKCASLAVQLSLSGGLSARLWEFNIKNWVAYQALMKHPSPERSANTMTDEQTTLPCKINSTAYSKMNTSSEYVLDISLPRKTKKPPKVYITLLRKYISSNSSNFMHQSTSKINTDPSDLNNPPSDLDHSLVVEDLTAPYIDDLEYDCTVDKLSTSLKSKSEPVSNFDDEFLSKYLKVPGRFHQVPTQNLSSERLRELSANIIAGPYLLSDFLDVHGRYCCMPLTSSELIKCCSRLFALHIKIVLPETEVRVPLEILLFLSIFLFTEEIL